MPPHTDSTAAKHVLVRISNPGEQPGEDTLEQPALVLDYGNGLVYVEGAPQELLALTHQLWAAAATVAMPWARHQFLITVAAADPATETIVRRLTGNLTARVDGHTPLRVTVHRQGRSDADLYERTCRVGGEPFYTYGPDVDVCHRHWYSEQIAAAKRRYAPLIGAIRQATGLASYVWQSGGMTMMLVTPWDADNQDPDVGNRYLTLVEKFHADGRLEGASGFLAAGDEHGGMGDTVVSASDDARARISAESPNAPEAQVVDAPITPDRWATAIADDYQRRRRGDPAS